MIVGSMCTGFRQYQRRRSRETWSIRGLNVAETGPTSGDLRTYPFNHYTDGVRESDGVVWGVG